MTLAVVVPRAGTWIEMYSVHAALQAFSSYPVRVRGLKCEHREQGR